MMGMLPLWADDDDRWLALEALERDAHAASTRESMEAKLRTIHRALVGWGLVPFPPSMWTVRALGATLKRGGYRSAASYLWLYKAEAQRRGHSWPDYLHRALRDAVRSCERGMGPPTRALPLPFARLGSLPPGRAPWVRGGPLCPRNALVIGSWWMMREVELSTVRAVHVDLTGDWTRNNLHAKLTLPASKNDAAALGAARAHRCHCVGAITVMCPTHAIADQLGFLRRAFPDRFINGRPMLDLPLFPDAQGRVVNKVSMSATIVAGGRTLGVRDELDGSFKLTGHSLRSTGAQGLISIGWRPDAVQLQGRWQSDTVRRYTREAALYAPDQLVALMMALCGVSREEVPPPPAAEPEPPDPPAEEWILNAETGMYHVESSTEGRARCGWIWARTGVRGRVPPPWHLITCKQCVPERRRRLKASAQAAAASVRGRSLPLENP